MSRKLGPEPWFNAKRSLWYLTLDGKQINLGADEEKARDKWHKLMAAEEPEPEIEIGSVADLVRRFMSFCRANRAADTVEWYRYRLERLVNFKPKDSEEILGNLPAQHLRPYHVQEWIDSYTVSSGTKRNYVRAIKTAMQWAEDNDLIPRSPIRKMRKPRAGKREEVISEEQWNEILGCVRDRQFRDLLLVTWETGCRPQESLRVEARHVDLQNGRWVFPQSEEKTQTAPRVIYLTERALEITKRLVLKNRKGKLFRNTDGKPWTPDAVNCRFQTIAKKTGKKYCLYVIRHSWFNRLLTRGVDALTAAILGGHCDPSTLSKFYQHLTLNPTFLKETLKKVQLNSLRLRGLGRLLTPGTFPGSGDEGLDVLLGESQGSSNSDTGKTPASSGVDPLPGHREHLCDLLNG